MDEQTQQMMLMLTQVYMEKFNEQDPEAAMQAVVQLVQAAQEDDTQAQQVLQQLLEEAQGGAGAEAESEIPTQMARHGAKLSYIRRLRGECPYGTEMVMFKRGGRVCKKCMKKKVEKALPGTKLLALKAAESFKKHTTEIAAKMRNKVKARQQAQQTQQTQQAQQTQQVQTERCGGKSKLKKRYYGGWI